MTGDNSRSGSPDSIAITTVESDRSGGDRRHMTCRRTPSERTTVRRSSRAGRQSVGSHAGKLMSGNPTHDLRAIRWARQRMRPHHAVRPVQCAPQCSGTSCSCAPADDGRRTERRAATGCTLPRPDMLHPAGVSGSVGRMWGLANRRGEQSAVADGGWLAEAVRFELTDGCPSPVFKTGALNHSATLPATCQERCPELTHDHQGTFAAPRFVARRGP